MIESNHSDYFDNIVGANAWMLWLFIPIPLACVFYGMYLKKKGYKSKATTVIGVCMIAALLVAGSSSNYSDYDYTDIDKLTMWEDEIGFDFPDKGEVVTLEDFDMEEDSSEYYETTVVRLSDKDAENFTEKILQSDKWVTEFPDNIELYSAYDSLFDYHLLYNKTTGQINEAPEKSGEYTFVYFKYLESDKVLVVEKYTMHLNIA